MTVLSSVGIFEDARALCADAVDFVVDDGGASFEFMVDGPSLRDLVHVCTQALAKLDAAQPD